MWVPCWRCVREGNGGYRGAGARDVLAIVWPLAALGLGAQDVLGASGMLRDLSRTLALAVILFVLLLLVVGYARAGPLHRTFDSVWWQLVADGTHKGIARTSLGVRLPRLGGWLGFLRAAAARSEEELGGGARSDLLAGRRHAAALGAHGGAVFHRGLVRVGTCAAAAARALAGGGGSGDGGSTPLRGLTIGNLATDSSWRWLPVFLVWGLTWFLLKLLSSLTAQYTQLRWTVSPERAGGRMRAVLVSDVPTHSEDVAAAMALALDPAQLAEVGSNISATCRSCMATLVWLMLDIMPGRLVLKYIVVPLSRCAGGSAYAPSGTAAWVGTRPFSAGQSAWCRSLARPCGRPCGAYKVFAGGPAQRMRSSKVVDRTSRLLVLTGPPDTAAWRRRSSSPTCPRRCRDGACERSDARIDAARNQDAAADAADPGRRAASEPAERGKRSELRQQRQCRQLR